MGINSEVIQGHDLLALERFRDDTRHMDIFDVLTGHSPYGAKGKRLRLFLSDKAHGELLAAQARGEVSVLKHATVIEGHILPDKKAKRRRGR